MTYTTPLSERSHSGNSTPHSFASDCELCGEIAVAERVIALWNKHRGWIPGASYKELAEVLGVDVDRLTHYRGRGLGHHVVKP